MPNLKYLPAGLALIGLIVLYALEFSWFDRTLRMKELALWSMGMGALLGLGLGWRFREQGRNLTEKVQVYVFFTLICVIFAPLAGSLSNRLLSLSPLREETIEIFGQQPYFASLGIFEEERPLTPTGYYTFFYYQDKLRRIKSDEPLFPERQRGDTVILHLQRGLWGFELVQDGK